MSEWQPIETARRLPPGTKIVVFRPLAGRTRDPLITIASVQSEQQHCYDQTVPRGADGKNFTDRPCYPTHWMPLPAPPSAEVIA